MAVGYLALLTYMPILAVVLIVARFVEILTRSILDGPWPP